jgi:hypothetical protein
MGGALAPGGGFDGVRASARTCHDCSPICADVLRTQDPELLLQELPGARHVALRGAKVSHR